MSERMIERQRAKMGLPVNTTQSLAPTSSAAGSSASHPTKSSSLPKIYAQDDRMCQFLHRLKKTKPTVPPSLTRRILNKQGVGFSDPLVSTIVSSAADRFLATILSQSLVCRDRRLKGEDLAKKEHRESERRKKRRRAERDTFEGKRQKLEKELEDFATGAGVTSKKDSRKVSSGLAKVLEKGGLDTVVDKDSIHDEENYYEKIEKGGEDINEPQGYEEDEVDYEESDDDDDDRDILQLRDLARPLEAWNMSLAGKLLASEPSKKVASDGPLNEEDEENLVVDGEDVGDEEDEDVVATSGEGEKTPARKKRIATPKASPRSGKTSPTPGKSDDASSSKGKK
mmetsp:Transcript_16481/g.24134  ORF Transcript_16481/g.24134 Transcript_16481/m.24134 type:complete len:341 (-) Transcript_16481:151-1173(-)